MHGDGGANRAITFVIGGHRGIEEVREDIGAQLVHRSGFGVGPQAAGAGIDRRHDAGCAIGLEVEGVEVRGA